MSHFEHWGEYAHLQLGADRRKLNDKAWAADEEAEEFLESIANNTLKSGAALQGLAG